MEKKSSAGDGNFEGGKPEEYLRLLIESATDYAIFTLDRNRLVTSWNTGAQALTGFSEHEISGQLADLLYTPEDRDNNVLQIETEIAQKEGRALNERWHVRKDGSQFWGSGSVSPLRDNDGKLLGFVKIMRDLTERKEAEERYGIRLEQEVGDRTTKLKESREQFASLVENTPDYITRWDKDLKLIFANTAFKMKTGEANETLLGKTNSEMGEAKETAIPFVASLRKAFETDKAVEHYNSFSTPAGKVHFYTKMIPEKNAVGEIETVLAIARDITEVKEAEQELIRVKEELARLATDQYLTLFNSIDEGFYIAEMIFDENDLPVDILYLEENPSAVRIVERSLKGKRLTEVSPDYEPEWFEVFGGVAVTGESKRMEQFSGPDKKYFNFYITKIGDEASRQIAVVFHDITELKKARQELEQSRNLMQSVFNASYNGLSVLKSIRNENGELVDMEYLFANEATKRTNNRYDLEGKRYSEVHAGFKGTNYHEVVKQVVETGEPRQYQLHYNFEHLDNWFNITTVKLDDGVVISFEDITEVKKAEIRLGKSEERLRILANTVPQIIWSNNAEGYANYFNQRWYEFSGLNYEQSAGLGWQVIVHPQDAPASVGKWQEALARGEVFDTEYRLRRHDETYRWFIGRNVPLKDDAGKITGWFGSATDIEDLKKTEEALSQSEARLRITMESATDYAIISMDTERRVERWSSGASQMFGYTEAEVMGRSADIIFTEEDLKAGAPQKEEEMARDTGRAPDERWHRRKDGSRFFVSGVMRPINNGHLTGYVKVMRDMTHEHLFTEELHRLVEERTKELQQSNSDLRQFAHVASHDLKEPVRKIQTFKNRLLDEYGEMLQGRARTYVEKIGTASDRMVSMIDGVLHYSKLGNIDETFEAVDLDEVIQSIETDLEVLIQEKQAVISKKNLATITASRILMYQLFYNLILNSLKFAKKDEVSRIDVLCEKITEGGRDVAKIIVSDNGIGFEPEYQELIFKTFTRLHPADEYEGTGLGLALCKKIVDGHGGSISATGVLDQGAVFTIILPEKRPAGMAAY
jgi:PAS domain S-box-containing protein